MTQFSLEDTGVGQAAEVVVSAPTTAHFKTRSRQSVWGTNHPPFLLRCMLADRPEVPYT